MWSRSTSYNWLIVWYAQSVVCHQGLLWSCHWLRVCVWRCRVTGNMTWALFCGYTRKRLTEHPTPLWQACKVLHQWELFRETMVYVHIYAYMYNLPYVQCTCMRTTCGQSDKNTCPPRRFYSQKVIQTSWSSVQSPELFTTPNTYIQKAPKPLQDKEDRLLRRRKWEIARHVAERAEQRQED